MHFTSPSLGLGCKMNLIHFNTIVFYQDSKAFTITPIRHTPMIIISNKSITSPRSKDVDIFRVVNDVILFKLAKGKTNYITNKRQFKAQNRNMWLGTSIFRKWFKPLSSEKWTHTWHKHLAWNSSNLSNLI